MIKKYKEKTKIETEQPQRIFSILDRDVICLHRTDFLPHFTKTTLHNHDGYEFLLYLSGNTNYYVESEGKKLEYGELILTAPYTFHGIDTQTDQTYERIIINIKEAYFKGLCSEKTDLASCFNGISSNKINSYILNKNEIQEFSDIAARLQHELDNPGYGSDILVPALLVQLLVMINKKTSNDSIPTYQSIIPRIVADTISYVNNHLGCDLSLNTLSSHLYHNGDYISRCFKNTMGTTLQQFIIAKRIVLAQQYLREGYTVVDTCFLSGFSDYSNFSRCFSKHVGMSPTRYRKENKFN